MFLVLLPHSRPIHVLKVIHGLLDIDLRDAKAAYVKPPFYLDESRYDVALIRRILTEQGIAFRLLDGEPKRVNRCCVCGMDTVREWLPYDLFADPEDAERYGGQPLCAKCFKTVPFEKIVAAVEPPTAWDRLGGVWEDDA